MSDWGNGEWGMGKKYIYASYTSVDAMLALQDYRIKIFAPVLQSFDKINLNLLDEEFRKYSFQVSLTYFL